MYLNLKRLYVLKQASRSWYDKLNNFVLENDFKVRKINMNLLKNERNKEFICPSLRGRYHFLCY